MIRACLIINFAVLILLAGLASPLAAQRELISVAIEPDRSDWDWQSYAESISDLFANSIESRVTAGYDTREFVPDTAATVLRFAFRIGQNGELLRFTQLATHNRYHAYLIRCTARRVAPFRALPRAFPAFYFDGMITFTCRFQPTRWYKKLYFEQPIDTLALPDKAPLVRKIPTTGLLSNTYEPIVTDKRVLLEEFKKRIGVSEEITDTSAYTALPVEGRMFLVRVPYDSLAQDAQNRMLLQARIEVALEEAGARISTQDYDPEEVRRRNQEEAAKAAALAAEAALRDSIAAAARIIQMAAGDSTLAMDSTSLAVSDSSGETEAMETQASEATSSSIESAITAVAQAAETAAAVAAAVDSTKQQAERTASAPQDIPPDRNLAEAFGDIFHKDFLVFSAGLARDSLSDSAACHIKLYPSSNPSDLKRNFVYKFRFRGSLPDSIGYRLVKRLTAPPAKPEPPKPAAEPAKAAAGDSTAAGTAPPVAGAPSAAAPADTTAKPAGTAPAATATPADSSAAPSVAPADSSAAATPDSRATPDSSAAPADTGRAAPADSTSGKADSTAAPAPAAPDSTSQQQP